MANILLTTRCTRSCPYCFAEKEMADGPDQLMSWENVVYLADFLTAGGERAVSLLGGEPTLHPNFTDYALYLLERGFRVSVFTNGIMSSARLDEIREHLSPIPTEKLTFVCNLNNPEQTPAPDAHQQCLQDFLSAMGPHTQPGFNIYRADFDLQFIFDLVERYRLKRKLRLGFAHPVPGGRTAYLRPDEMAQAIEKLLSYKAKFDSCGLEIGPDCGVPICKFNDAQLGWLYRLGCGELRFRCGPAIDITPDMNVYACFPLAQLSKRSIFEFDTLGQVVEFFQGVYRDIRRRTPGIYPECDGCVHLSKGLCSGGGACQLIGGN